MEELLKKLLAILEQKDRHFKQLLDLVKQEKESIVHNRTEELQDLVGRQEQMVKTTAQLEKERIKLTWQIAEGLKIPGKQVTMSQIITAVSEPYKSGLTKMYNQIVATLQEMDGLNKINAELVKSSLNYINFSLKTFNKASNINPTYEGSGKIKDILKERKSFDKEI